MQRTRLSFEITALMLVLASCASPPRHQYCDQFAARNTPHYQQCEQHYIALETSYREDFRRCSLGADELYPPSLYDKGRFEPSIGAGLSNPFWGTRMATGQMVYVEPDHRRNAELDALRMRLIAPCLKSRGWKNPTHWQAGKTNGGNRVQRRFIPGEASPPAPIHPR